MCTQLVIHPPEWVAEASQAVCHKCREPFKKHKHFCRTCGRIFCPECTTKMTVPQAFLRKGKQGEWRGVATQTMRQRLSCACCSTGPTRVCHMCRYLILSGARLESAPPARGAPRFPPGRPPVQATASNLTVEWEGGTFITEITVRATQHQRHTSVFLCSAHCPRSGPDQEGTAVGPARSTHDCAPGAQV